MLVPASAVVLALSLMLSRWVELMPHRSMWLPLTLRLKPIRPPTLAPSPRLALLSRVSATEVVSAKKKTRTFLSYFGSNKRTWEKVYNLHPDNAHTQRLTCGCSTATEVFILLVELDPHPFAIASRHSAATASAQWDRDNSIHVSQHDGNADALYKNYI